MYDLTEANVIAKIIQMDEIRDPVEPCNPRQCNAWAGVAAFAEIFLS